MLTTRSVGPTWIALAFAAAGAGPLLSQNTSPEQSGAARTPGSSGIDVTASVQQAAFRDFSASPMIYRGTGGVFSVGYRRRRANSRFAVDLGFGYAGLSPRDASGAAFARDFSARSAISSLRRLGALGAEWLAGPVGSVDVSARVHRYSDPNQTEHLFGHARVSLGAALRAESRPSAGITWTQELRTPLVHWALWPYSAPTMRDRGKFEVIGFNRLRGVEELLTIGAGTWSWTYRFSLLHADDAAGRRYARHEIGTRVAFSRGGRR